MDIENSDNKLKRRIRTFEADEDVDLMLTKAQEDGVNLRTICNAALRRYGRQLVSAYFTSAAAKWGKPLEANSSTEIPNDLKSMDNAATHLGGRLGRKKQKVSSARSSKKGTGNKTIDFLTGIGDKNA